MGGSVGARKQPRVEAAAAGQLGAMRRSASTATAVGAARAGQRAAQWSPQGEGEAWGTHGSRRRRGCGDGQQRYNGAGWQRQGHHPPNSGLLDIPGAHSLTLRDGGIETVGGQELVVSVVQMFSKSSSALEELSVRAKRTVAWREVACGSVTEARATGYGSGRGTGGDGHNPSNPTRGQARGRGTPSLNSIHHHYQRFGVGLWVQYVSFTP